MVERGYKNGTLRYSKFLNQSLIDDRLELPVLEQCINHESVLENGREHVVELLIILFHLVIP